MKIIDRTLPVMVTGATGYIAGVLVKRLLAEGLTVHATVRDPDSTNKLQYLNAIADNSPGQIKYFKADLMEEGSYAEAMAGCQLVFHTASPFKIRVEDPQKELVDPAKLGTRNVLEEACRTPSVKRVVLTSSCAAIYGDNADLHNTPDGIFTEGTWNTSSSLLHNPYSYSKTIAEREAWKINDSQVKWDLVVINPTLVIGPGINPNGDSESFTFIRRMGDGTLKSGIPRWGFGVVDVRDLAEAHFRVGFTPRANGRYIISAHNTDLFSMSQLLLAKYGEDFPIPRRSRSKWLLWLLGPIIDRTVTRKMIARNIDLPWKGDNSRSKKTLGMSYRSLSDSMNDFFEQMVTNGLLKSSVE